MSASRSHFQRIFLLLFCVHGAARIFGQSGGTEKKKHRPQVPSTQFKIQPRIVGGDQSDENEFPYFVDMRWCGGVLIAPRVVLSAAHCGSFDGTEVIVSGLWQGSTDGGGSIKSVVDGVMHPEYNSQTLESDLYLHLLDSTVELDANITLKLNFNERIPVNGDPLTVMGMGYTEEDGSVADRLRDVEVVYIDTDECNKNYRRRVTNSMFCAGVDDGGKDSCNGDSGGPIVFRSGNEDILTGIVSWGYGCARKGYPGVYARVSPAADWIREVVCDNWEEEADFCVAKEPNLDTSNSTECSMLNVFLQTDDAPQDNSFLLLEEGGLLTDDNSTDLLLNMTSLDASSPYNWNICLESLNETCYTLDISDSSGDGLNSNGHIYIQWDRKVLYDGREIGSGIQLKFGEACNPL